MRLPDNSAPQVRMRRFRAFSIVCAGLILLLLFLSTRCGASGLAVFTGPLDSLAIYRAQAIGQWQTKEWLNTWHGVPLLQYPGDLVAYENIIFEVKPDFVIETGTYRGGLTLFLASLLDSMDGDGRLVTLDIVSSFWEGTLRSTKIKDSLLRRITFVQGDTNAIQTYNSVAKLVAGRTALVILDSGHLKDHVLGELNQYSNLVSVDSYIVVNDTQLDETGFIGFQAGPKEAVEEFLSSHPQFQLDTSRDRYMMSSAHSGFLKRIR